MTNNSSGAFNDNGPYDGKGGLPNEKVLAKLRIDKWLWAARFFKTRSLAAAAVKNGKVLVDGEKVKASRELYVGEMLTVKQGVYSKIVKVQSLSAQRRCAAIAQKLYQETDDSRQQREQLAEMLKLQPGIRRSGQGRPTKKERRQIIQFTEKPL